MVGEDLMSTITQLRGVVLRLQTALRAAIADRAAPLDDARAIATLAVEIAGGTGGRIEEPESSWEQDTLTELQLDLAFVLGCVERAARDPQRRPHLTLDAHTRLELVAIQLSQTRSG